MKKSHPKYYENEHFYHVLTAGIKPLLSSENYAYVF